ncbi:MAG TPA: adenylate/guanylate cyclase domain-containing protein [Gammaproteobacteria bacterium]|nr:adenylate/guanylate cyclase domain-containing protein [Gammaproteobacteria bacterium]
MKKYYAIMFADVAGSTKMYDTLGDVEAEKQISWCIQTMSDITRQHGGHVVKTIGDEIMASFVSADDAAEAAIEMQNSISGDPSNALKIRIGLQYGSAIERDKDLYGDAVNVAARMAGIAKALQIITTEDVFKQLKPALVDKTRLFDRASVKGKSAELHIYQINWEEESQVTRFATSLDMKKINAMKQAIVLKILDEEKLLSVEDFTAAISIGRDDSCGISLDAQYASRSHATLDLRRGKFILIDQSTNGTYVQFNGQEELFIRREEIMLQGEGSISLGESVSSGSPTVMRFSVLQAG